MRKIIVIMFCFLFASCSCKKEPDVRKLEFGEGYDISEGAYGISDGIKLVQNDTVQYFIISISSPPSYTRNRAEIEIKYKKFNSHKVLISENTVSDSIDNGYPFYQLNTLNVIDVKNKYGIFFYTILGSYPYDMDPTKLIMWVYYEGELFKISAIIPVHQDWDWNSTYKFVPDSRLENEYPELYKQVLFKWNKKIELLKKMNNTN